MYACPQAMDRCISCAGAGMAKLLFHNMACRVQLLLSRHPAVKKAVAQTLFARDFLGTAPLQVQRLDRDQVAVMCACRDLMASQDLKVLLDTTLVVSNKMNEGTSKGNAKVLTLFCCIHAAHTV